MKAISTAVVIALMSFTILVGYVASVSAPADAESCAHYCRRLARETGAGEDQIRYCVKQCESTQCSN